MTRWLSVVGIGEDGIGGLSAAARAALDSADLLIGGERHLGMIPDDGRERHCWPTPMSDLLDRIPEMRGRKVCVLASGDPMFFGVGATLAQRVPFEEMTVLPAPSAFSLAAARLGWPLHRTATISLHGRPIETLALHVAPGARLLMLTADASTPAAVRDFLVARGFGESRMICLAHMGSEKETRFEATANGWGAAVPDLNTLAVECVAAPDAVWHPRTGLPDDAFEHDGLITKREFRALALAKLMPHPGGLLWDIGAGSGSIAIEWMRAADHARAVALEPNDSRRAAAARNATTLGAPGLELIGARAPEALAVLPAPDAIFIGGGLTPRTLAACLDALRPGGRLVAHSVSLQSEAMLLAAYQRHQGELVRIAVDRAAPLGAMTAWQPARPVMQWAWRKA
jgi:precorrin-6Y C5,15-methyltransferase (decarboxylating)